MSLTERLSLIGANRWRFVYITLQQHTNISINLLYYILKSKNFFMNRKKYFLIASLFSKRCTSKFLPVETKFSSKRDNMSP